ncbi:MAG: CorA family divalent cation transporter [Candidatus Zipacnadales bacterium]
MMSVLWEVQLYLRDVHGHVIKVIETINAFTPVAVGLLDLYVSAFGNQTNAVIKLLTLIMTPFIPLILVVDIYGMIDA